MLTEVSPEMAGAAELRHGVDEDGVPGGLGHGEELLRGWRFASEAVG